MTSLLACAVNRGAGNPAYMGAVSWGVEKLAYVSGGNLVNSLGHAGVRPFRALAAGEIEQQAGRHVRLPIRES